jgi:hypothetical protein
MRFLSISLLLVLVSCSIEPGPASLGPSGFPRTEASKRPATRPEGPRVENEAFGNSHRRLERAIADLKRLGFWDRLTDHLFVLKLGSRLGTANLPEDGHLADASSTGIVEGEESGAYCDLMFYVTAIHQDLQRWRSFYRRGLVDKGPPSLTRFWAMLLAHELTHCLPRGHGEEAATRAEEEVRQAYRART